MTVPVDGRELHEIARAVTEIADALSLDGPGVTYCRMRVAKADSGRWGEDGIAAEIERRRMEAEEQRRAELRAGLNSFEAAFRREARKLGGRLLASGEVEWPREPNDFDGTKRRQRAIEAARAALATNGGGR